MLKPLLKTVVNKWLKKKTMLIMTNVRANVKTNVKTSG